MSRATPLMPTSSPSSTLPTTLISSWTGSAVAVEEVHPRRVDGRGVSEDGLVAGGGCALPARARRTRRTAGRAMPPGPSRASSPPGRTGTCSGPRRPWRTPCPATTRRGSGSGPPRPQLALQPIALAHVADRAVGAREVPSSSSVATAMNSAGTADPSRCWRLIRPRTSCVTALHRRRPVDLGDLAATRRGRCAPKCLPSSSSGRNPVSRSTACGQERDARVGVDGPDEVGGVLDEEAVALLGLRAARAPAGPARVTSRTVPCAPTQPPSSKTPVVVTSAAKVEPSRRTRTSGTRSTRSGSAPDRRVLLAGDAASSRGGSGSRSADRRSRSTGQPNSARPSPP